MIAFELNIAALPFWVTALLAIAALNLTTQGTVRKWLQAAINLGFIAILLRSNGVYVALALLVLWLGLHAIQRARRPAFWVAPLAFVCLLLFLTTKLSIADFYLHSMLPRQLLATIGFSYIALRIVEVLRAVASKRLPSPHLADLINYLAPFHMLAAGPIQSYEDFVHGSLHTETPVPLDILRAVERIAFGLFKKFVVASILKDLFLDDFRSSGLLFFIEVQIFFLWLYLDFSAYSDIAVGLGRLMGVSTPENFNRPYLARNMVDFWERWHISLSLFIRRNLYIPLFATLTRRSPSVHPLALSAVSFGVAFTLCGLWHEFTLNYLLWGIAQSLGLIVSNIYNYELRRRLSPRSRKAYLANPLIRCLAIFTTYQFVAFSMLTLFFPA